MARNQAQKKNRFKRLLKKADRRLDRSWTDRREIRSLKKHKSPQAFRQERLRLKSEVRHHEKQVQVDRQQYRTAKKMAKKESNNPELKTDKKVVELKDRLKESKAKASHKRQTYRRYLKKDDTHVIHRLRESVKSPLKQNLKGSAIGSLKSKLQEDDTFAEGLQIYDQVQQRRYQVRVAKGISKNSLKSGKNVTKFTYNLGNRSKNLISGHGFHKTPFDKQLFGSRKAVRNFRHKAQLKLRRRLRQLSKKHRYTAKGLKGLKQGISQIFRFFGAPLKVKVGLIALLLSPLLFVLMVSGSNQPGLKQTNLELNNTWLTLTKLDANHTNGTHTYYTNWAPYQFYLNELLGDFNPEGSAYGLNQFQSNNYQDVLSRIWDEVHAKDGQEFTYTQLMNGQTPASTDMNSSKNIYRTQANPFILSSDDQAELKASIDEMGFDVLGNQLANPFDSDAITINRRFGYEKNNQDVTLHKTSTLAVNPQAAIKAPMAGQVKILNDHSLMIVQDNENRQAQVIIDGLSLGHGAGPVAVGDYLGAASSNQIDFGYQLFDQKNDRWTDVNIGFYLKNVTYSQFSTTVDDIDSNAGKTKRAQQIFDFLTKKGYQKAAIAAMIGNFDVESSINPKRAEGDYLKTAAGKHDGSYDDENWLALGGPAIYDGRFANIIHRGLGLGQWTDVAPGPGGRHTMLLDYAKSQNKKWYDLETQIGFMIDADSKADMVKSFLSTSSQDVPMLTKEFLVNWEGNAGDKLQERTNAALSWYKYLNQTKDDKKQAADEKSAQEIRDQYGNNQST